MLMENYNFSGFAVLLKWISVQCLCPAVWIATNSKDVTLLVDSHKLNEHIQIAWLHICLFLLFFQTMGSAVWLL